MDVADAQTGADLVRDDIGEKVQRLFQDFLEEWTVDGEVCYLEDAKNLIKPERNTLTVSLPHLEEYNQSLELTIKEEYYRVYPYLCRGLRNYVRDHTEVAVEKEFYIAFSDNKESIKVRELNTGRIGNLVSIQGQVVRTHPVHPELVSGTFRCLDCQTVMKDVEQQFKYTQPTICRNPVCNNRQRFMLETHKSKFVDFQKVRIQEIQSELPRGSIPRSVEIVLRAEAVEMAQAGDHCNFTGTLIVVPDVGVFNMPGARAETASRHKAGNNAAQGVRGLKALGVRDLNYRMAMLACHVEQSNPQFTGSKQMGAEQEVTAESIKNSMSELEWDKVYKMSKDKNLYQNLITSMFPTIHGNDEVKRGIMLMLFGGVPKTTNDGTTLRGDVNCCVVGDPSTAKSQFLKMVADFCPRAVYTSGKASSAAGLTAAVVKDEESHEFVIEAGALMLADNSVCCIDEFDKMDVKDQVAIHEAMEQQTISITKAGVKATLHARTSILAAANPIGGRYDRSKSLKQNVNLSAPIMSRFDLFFILVDECNEVTDYAIARRIVDLHCRNEESIDRVYLEREISRYIMFARQFKPKMNKDAADYLVEQYKHLRQRDATGSARSAWRITVRQLESMIRLSEGMARMHCLDEVQPKHVKEAFRLLNKSIIRVEQPDVHLDDDADPEAMDAEDAPATNGEAEPENAEDEAADAGKMRLSYQDYKAMSNLIISYMRREEDKQEEQEGEGVKRSQVIEWYLEEIAGDIETEADLGKKKLLVEKVLECLIYKDQVIIPLTKADLKKGAKGKEDDAEEDPILIVHPNFVIED